VETVAKASAADESTEESAEPQAESQAKDQASKKPSKPATSTAKKKAVAEVVEKETPRELFDHVLTQGRKDYAVQRYKGLGEMSSQQLWETTLDPEKRTLLSVKLEDLAESETIFTTLMGEDVEARGKFIEENALDVKNLDIRIVRVARAPSPAFSSEGLVR